MNKKYPKQYIAIVKVGNNTDTSAKCVKYRFDDLLKFTVFLNQKWSAWKWFNMYSNKGENKGKQVGNFTKNKRPTRSKV